MKITSRLIGGPHDGLVTEVDVRARWLNVPDWGYGHYVYECVKTGVYRYDHYEECSCRDCARHRKDQAIDVGRRR